MTALLSLNLSGNQLSGTLCAALDFDTMVTELNDGA